MTDTNQLPPHTITINDHPEPHIMQWSDLELAAVKRYAEQYALQARAQVQGEVCPTCGETEPYTGSCGTSNNDTKALCKQPAQATSAPADVVRYSERELELIDWMIAVQLDHAQRCDAISNRVMGEKQKGWDMERVELLLRIRSLGITAQKGTNGEIS